MKYLLLVAFVLSMALAAFGQSENLVLVTLDGFRWEELFGGAVDSLMQNSEYSPDSAFIADHFGAASAQDRRAKLLPWIWSTVEQEGQIYGNRRLGNKMNLTNIFWFSYPGYNEILTGVSDPNITSNAKEWNPNETLLEWFNDHPQFAERVAAFGSWDVFPFIINEDRSGIPVNAGFEKAEGDSLSPRELFLNEIQESVPSPWSSVRLDFFTHHYAMEYLKRKHPRITYISYGETDDFAHDGRYDHYLRSAHQTDKWLEELWTYLQEDEFYAGKTTLIVTTDHGRGNHPAGEWKSHGKTYEGSNATWLIAMGPDIVPLGEVSTNGQIWTNQVAKTAAKLLGYDYSHPTEEVGEIIESVIKR